MLAPQLPFLKPTFRFTRTPAQWGSVALALLLLAGQAQAQWKAYNDHGPGTNGTQTHVNATTLNMSTPGSVQLKKITDGSLLTGPSGPVTLTVSLVGAINSLGSGINPPNAGSPLANEFGGYVWFGTSTPNGAIQVAQTCTISLSFTNLDSNKRYKFKGGTVRGNNFLDRWSIVDILGITSCTPNHQASSCTAPYTFATASTAGATGLSGYQVAFNAGENRCGMMVEYDDIAPVNGGFTVTSTRFMGTIPGATVGGGSYSYALSGLSLEECFDCGSGGAFEVKISPGGGGGATNVMECSTVMFTAAVCWGTPPYTYQWYKDGMPITGAENWTLDLPNVQQTDQADYSVVVRDSTPGEAQMAIDSTTLIVTEDPIAPTIVSAIGGPDLYTITVYFSKPVSITGVSDFSVLATNGSGSLTLNSAVATNNTVVLTTVQPMGGKRYKVVVNGTGVVGCNNLSVPSGSSINVLLQLALLAFNAAWQYNDSNTDLGTAWLADRHGGFRRQDRTNPADDLRTASRHPFYCSGSQRRAYLLFPDARDVAGKRRSLQFQHYDARLGR